MKPDYKHLGEVGDTAVSEWWLDKSIKAKKGMNPQEAFARAVIEECDRLRMAEGGEGMPSVDKMFGPFIAHDDINSIGDFISRSKVGLAAVRNLLLSAFAKQLEEKEVQITNLERQHANDVELIEVYVDRPSGKDYAEMQAKLAAAEKRLAELERLGKPYAIASVLLSRQTSSGLQTSQSLHYRERITSKNEMRGIAIESAMLLKPGFSVDAVLVEIIDHSPPAPTAEEVSRAEIEKWAKSKSTTICYDLTRSSWSDNYEHQITRDLWEGSQAHASKEAMV